jgi:hypothetical protein
MAGSLRYAQFWIPRAVASRGRILQGAWLFVCCPVRVEALRRPESPSNESSYVKKNERIVLDFFLNRNGSSVEREKGTTVLFILKIPVSLNE